MRTIAISLILLAPLLAGCGEYNHYELTLKPNGASMERRLACWRVPESRDNKATFPPEELARLSDLYPGQKVDPNATRHTFEGKFGDTMPADIGGRGTYTFWSTPAGSASFYVERFRGNDNLDALNADRQKAADRASEILVGWFDEQMGSDPHFGELRKFLENDFRVDLRNASHYWWLARSSDKSENEAGIAFTVRMGQYLLERGYFTPQELPEIVRISQSNRPDASLHLLQRWLGRKLKLSPDEVPKVLGFLSDPDKVKASWEAYMRTTPEYKIRLEATRGRNVQPGELDPNSIIMEMLLGTLFPLDMVSRPDELHLELQLPSAAVQTNGQPDNTGTKLTWDSRVSPQAAVPVVCYATWATPDADFQQAHFGRTVLSGSGLIEYVTWYRALSADEKAEWDAFVAALQPGPKLVVDITAFNFKKEAESPPSEPLANLPKGLLLPALQQKPPQ